MSRLFGDLRAWVWAGWIGALAGVCDGSAAFLHPVAARALPFALLLYTLLGLVFHLAGRIALFWFPPRKLRTLLLGMQVVVFIVFFAAYGASTATGGWIASRSGLLASVAAAVVVGGIVGAVLTLRFASSSTRAARSSLLLLLPLMAVHPAAFAVETLLGTSSAGGRGVILISLDAARGDRVSALGYDRPTTPNLDRLVRSGIAYREALVECPGSGPSHATMLTGLSPLSHKLLSNADVLDERVDTLAERLRAEGFATAAFANNYYIDGRFGFAQGFDTFVNQYRAWSLKTWHPHHLLRATSVYQALHRFTRKPGAKDDDSLNGALYWLADRRGEDFFLFLHFMDPHAPYDAPPRIRDRFYQPRGEVVRDTEALRARLDRASQEEIDALVDLYDASVALADDKLGRLVARLEELGLLKTTLLVVTADHGEVLDENGPVFDHGLPGQGNLHVPLVLYGPEIFAGPRVVEGAVSSSRVASTILDLLGLPTDERSLFDVNGEPVPTGMPVHGLTGVAPSDVAYAYDGRFKLLLREGQVAGLFDLVPDPREARDLWVEIDSDSTLTARARALEEGLLDWIDAELAGAVVLQRQSDTAVDAQTQRSLRALGYID